MSGNSGGLISVTIDMNLLAMKFVKACLVALFGFGLALVGALAPATRVGELAPEFEIETQGGATFRLSDFRGRNPVYIVCWNTMCSILRKKIASVREIARAIRGQDRIYRH
jgi:hypothetical protein